MRDRETIETEVRKWKCEPGIHQIVEVLLDIRDILSEFTVSNDEHGEVENTEVCSTCKENYPEEDLQLLITEKGPRLVCVACLKSRTTFTLFTQEDKDA